MIKERSFICKKCFALVSLPYFDIKLKPILSPAHCFCKQSAVQWMGSINPGDPSKSPFLQIPDSIPGIYSGIVYRGIARKSTVYPSPAYNLIGRCSGVSPISHWTKNILLPDYMILILNQRFFPFITLFI